VLGFFKAGRLSHGGAMLDPVSALQNIYSVTKLIYDQVQLVKANQEQCKRLAERIGIIEQSVHNLDQITDKSQYEKGLNDLLAGLQNCLQFMKQLSAVGALSAFFKAGNYNQQFASLNEELKKSIQQLNLGLVVQQLFNREKDKLDQQADIDFIKKNHQEIISEIQKGNAGIGKLDLELKENHDITMNQLASIKALLMELNCSVEKPPIDRHHNDFVSHRGSEYQRNLHSTPTATEYQGNFNSALSDLNKLQLTSPAFKPIVSGEKNPSGMLTQLNPVPKAASRIKVSDLQAFLRLVAEGEQDKAEVMLKSDPALAFLSGDVTDLSKRTFINITGFQYAVWALDWHMWTMIKKYLPDDAAREQAQGFETGSWVKTYGVHADLNIVIQAYQTTIDLYNAGKWTEGHTAWVQQVGGAQLLLPAHVVNEYCHPTRPFDPLPSFIDKKEPLPRTRCIKDKGDWFTVGRLGNKFAVARGVNKFATAKEREADNQDVVVFGVRWRKWYPTDHRSICALNSTRITQRQQLIAELRPKAAQRRAA